MLKEGDRIPKFNLPNQDGEEVTSEELLSRNNYLVIYFYPKDNTPGCTTQGCLFRDLKDDLAEVDVEVVGVSKDDVSSHKKFAQKHDFNFDLLADEEGELCKEFGVLTEKNMFGKKFMGIQRSTFLVDEHGEIVAVWEKAKPVSNAKEVLEKVKEMN
jgi:peroxiredoxin Q/BCP